MTKFDIFTICTENYRDALDFTLPSWLKWDTVSNVYLYTNFTHTCNDSRVKVLNILPDTDNWLDIVGFKAPSLYDLLSHRIEDYVSGNFMYMDVDCYMMADVSHIFDRPFNVAATRMNAAKMANTGVWFARPGWAVEGFAREWISVQNSLRKKGIGVVEHVSPYEQIAFSHILHRELKGRTYLDVLPIDGKLYNYEGDDLSQWVANVHLYKPYILHFKGRTWRDPRSMEVFANYHKKVL